jgi:Tat protein secretion system quality control protein TatD with DNase activity
MRGKTNQPAYVVHTLDYAAEFLGITRENLIDASTQNAFRFFNIETEES